jgi:hypothetical protein
MRTTSFSVLAAILLVPFATPAMAVPGGVSVQAGPASSFVLLVRDSGQIRNGTSQSSAGPAASHVSPKPGGGTATPRVKKLSGKAGAACFRACMHGVSGSSWGNFCDYSCYGP